MKDTKIIIAPKTIIIAISLIVLLLILYQSKDVILLLFASLIISTALFPAVDWLEKRMSRGLAVLLIYIVGFIILLTLFIPFVMIIIGQFEEFISQFPAYWDSIEQFIGSWEVSRRDFPIIPEMSQIFESVTGYVDKILSESINITINIFSGFIAFITLATIVMFILLDRNELKKGFLTFFPQDMRDKTEDIMATMSQRVGGYVRGQVAVMIAVGTITGILLAIAQMPFALLLGIFAGVLEIIPIIGPLLSAIPAVLIAVVKGPWWYPLLVIGIYLLVQRIENTISPYILGKFLHMPSMVIITVLMFAGTTLGVVGVILAPAIAAAAYVLVQELYLHKVNPQSEKEDGEEQMESSTQ